MSSAIVAINAFETELFAIKAAPDAIQFVQDSQKPFASTLKKWAKAQNVEKVGAYVRDVIRQQANNRNAVGAAKFQNATANGAYVDKISETKNALTFVLRKVPVEKAKKAAGIPVQGLRAKLEAAGVSAEQIALILG